MSVLNQKTLKKSFQIEGTGLHSGKQVKMEVYPSEPNSGIVFTSYYYIGVVVLWT